MTNLFTQSFAICAAALLAFGSIGAIITVPPAHAANVGSPLNSVEFA